MTLMKSGELRHHTAWGIFWTFLQVFAERAIQAVIFFVVARLIGAADFGIAAIAIAPSAICVGILQGASHVIVQRQDIDSDYLVTAFTVTTLFGAVLGILILAGSPLLATLMESPALAPMMAITALAPLAGGLGAVPEGILTKRFAFRRLAVRRVVGVATAGVVCLILAYIGHGAWSIIVQSVLTVWIVSAISLATCGWRPKLGWSRQALREFTAFSGLIFSTHAMIQANIRLADIVIGYFAGPAAAGTFRLARTIMDLITSVTFNPISTILLPAFSRLGGPSDRLAIHLVRIISFCLLIFGIIVIAVAVCARTFSYFVLGSDWTMLGIILTILSFIFPTIAISAPTHSFMIAIGRPGVNLISNAIQLLTNLVFIAIGVQWGIIGATIAYVLRAYLAFAGMSFYLSRLFSGLGAQLLAGLGPLLIFCFLTVLFLEVARQQLGISERDIVANAALLFAGLAIYLLALRAGAKTILEEAFDLARLPPRMERLLRRLMGHGARQVSR